MSHSDELQPLLSATQAARYLGVSRRKFDTLGLTRSYVGRLPRWRKETLDHFIDEQAVTPAKLVSRAVRKTVKTRQPSLPTIVMDEAAYRAGRSKRR